jgi:farnesyl-diphosphate farnesyltransferase
MAALSWCYEFLTKKLSMFALAAETMDSDFGDFICILIEVYCALDGYEDDPTLSNNTKIERLRDLSTRLQSLDWDEAYICDVSSDNKYGILLREFQTIHEAFCGLQPQYRAIVSSAAQELAERMISFLGREINTLHDWNEHCYINAGGYAVSIARALISAELEDERNNAGAAVVFGLFCGKVDSIVDFSEDVAAGKVDVPLEILDKYCSDPKQLLTIEKQPDALRCLRECIINALTHLPDIVKYMSRVTNKSAFKLWTALQMPSMLAWLNTATASWRSTTK